MMIDSVRGMAAATATAAAIIIGGALGLRFAEAADPVIKVPAKCEVPPDLVAETPPLPRTTRSYRRDHRLKVVALGSSSTLGLGASDSSAAWPARLEAVLQTRLPGNEIRVVNQGVARQAAEQMLGRLDTDVLAEKPALVIWETGTAEAVRGADVDEFIEALLTGVDRMVAAGADVILMDPQFSRSTSQLINFQPYVAAIEHVAGMRGVARFSRFAVMKYWIDSERFSFMNRSGSEARKMADQVYDCIGHLLALEVVGGILVK
jgi:lysophospholipase L1-like esterase